MFLLKISQRTRKILRHSSPGLYIIIIIWSLILTSLQTIDVHGGDITVSLLPSWWQRSVFRVQMTFHMSMENIFSVLKLGASVFRKFFVAFQPAHCTSGYFFRYLVHHFSDENMFTRKSKSNWIHSRSFQVDGSCVMQNELLVNTHKCT